MNREMLRNLNLDLEFLVIFMFL